MKDTDMESTGFRPLEVTTDPKILKRKFNAQMLQIVSEEFHEYMLAHEDKIFDDVKDIRTVFENIPSGLKGVLEYKDYTWDYMDAYSVARYQIDSEIVEWYSDFKTWRDVIGKPTCGTRHESERCGMVAAVSQKVKDIFEELGVSKDEYIMKPVKLVDSDRTYYLLFCMTIPEDEISMKNSESCLAMVPAFRLSFKTFEERCEYMKVSPDRELGYRIIALPEKYKNRDLIYVKSDTNYFFSQRLIDAFEKHKVKGYEIFTRSYTQLKFI